MYSFVWQSMTWSLDSVCPSTHCTAHPIRYIFSVYILNMFFLSTECISKCNHQDSLDQCRSKSWHWSEMPLNADHCQSILINSSQCWSMPINSSDQCWTMPINARSILLDLALISIETNWEENWLALIGIDRHWVLIERVLNHEVWNTQSMLFSQSFAYFPLFWGAPYIRAINLPVALNTGTFYWPGGLMFLLNLLQLTF